MKVALGNGEFGEDEEKVSHVCSQINRSVE